MLGIECRLFKTHNVRILKTKGRGGGREGNGSERGTGRESGREEVREEEREERKERGKEREGGKAGLFLSNLRGVKRQSR